MECLKVVIADSLGWRVDYVFDNYQILDGGNLLLGLIYFSFQIYCDFSGYSDIAIGTSKLFGFELMSNFKFPYFSRDIGEFWRRWHISLSTWFRDYLYIPLGGSEEGKWLSIRNIFIIFIVSGFWHGANWTFIAWGMIHAILYIPLFLIGKNRKYLTTIVAGDRWFPSLKESFQMGGTFFLTMIAWVFFRSENINSAFELLIQNDYSNLIPSIHRSGVIPILLLVLIEWFMRKDERILFRLENKYARWSVYIFLNYLIIAHFKLIDLSQFIYFQF